MTRLLVSLDVPSAGEARRAAHALGAVGVGVRVGPRLIYRVGPAVVATMRSEAEVLVDTRMSGSDTEVVAGARALAALGARWITVDGAIGAVALKASAEAVAKYGAALVPTTVPPEAPDPAGGRGRAVSSLVQTMTSAGVAAVLGLKQDIGVVVQVAPDIPVVVCGVQSADDVADALARGALAVVVESGIARAVDPAAEVAPFAEAARAT